MMPSVEKPTKKHALRRSEADFATIDEKDENFQMTPSMVCNRQTILPYDIPQTDSGKMKLQNPAPQHHYIGSRKRLRNVWEHFVIEPSFDSLSFAVSATFQ